MKIMLAQVMIGESLDDYCRIKEVSSCDKLQEDITRLVELAIEAINTNPDKQFTANISIDYQPNKS